MGYLWDIYGKTYNKQRSNIGTRAEQDGCSSHKVWNCFSYNV